MGKSERPVLPGRTASMAPRAPGIESESVWAGMATPRGQVKGGFRSSGLGGGATMHEPVVGVGPRLTLPKQMLCKMAL